LLPITDVTEVETSAAAARKVELTDRIRDYHRRATPAAGAGTDDEQTFVLVPDSGRGKEYAELVRRTVPAALTIPVSGSATDLMFCREHGCLRTEELVAMLENCRAVYYQSLANPHTAPHARYDVTEWMPLSE